MLRLSKSSELLLCGRVLMFLAHILPLAEKSGVNLKGDFNKVGTPFSLHLKDYLLANSESRDR